MVNLPHSHDIGPRGAQPKEQFHFLEPDARLSRKGDVLTKTSADGTRVQLPPAGQAVSQPPTGPGWIEYGSWNDYTGKITELQGQWQVPGEPAVQAGQVIFLSLGLQTSKDVATDLFLPVLQWGPSAAGGGNYWSVSCWYQHLGRITFSELIKVEPGETIIGKVARTVDNEYGTEWVVSARIDSTGQTTSVPVVGELELSWPFVALEIYSPNMACDQFPAGSGTAFQNLSLKYRSSPLAPEWQGTVEYKDCGTRVEIPDPTEIRLLYD